MIAEKLDFSFMSSNVPDVTLTRRGLFNYRSLNSLSRLFPLKIAEIIKPECFDPMCQYLYFTSHTKKCFYSKNCPWKEHTAGKINIEYRINGIHFQHEGKACYLCRQPSSVHNITVYNLNKIPFLVYDIKDRYNAEVEHFHNNPFDNLTEDLFFNTPQFHKYKHTKYNNEFGVAISRHSEMMYQLRKEIQTSLKAIKVDENGNKLSKESSVDLFFPFLEMSSSWRKELIKLLTVKNNCEDLRVRLTEKFDTFTTARKTMDGHIENYQNSLNDFNNKEEIKQLKKESIENQKGIIEQINKDIDVFLKYYPQIANGTIPLPKDIHKKDRTRVW